MRDFPWENVGFNGFETNDPETLEQAKERIKRIRLAAIRMLFQLRHDVDKNEAYELGQIARACKGWLTVEGGDVHRIHSNFIKPAEGQLWYFQRIYSKRLKPRKV